MTRTRMQHALALAALTLLACGAGGARAQALNDPTRPPPGWLPVDPKAVVAKEAKAEGAESGVPVSILLVGPTRRFALVNGEMIGDKGKGTRIVDVKRNDVIVQSERGRETLNLFPDVKKTPPKKPRGMGEKD